MSCINIFSTQSFISIISSSNQSIKTYLPSVSNEESPIFHICAHWAWQAPWRWHRWTCCKCRTRECRRPRQRNPPRCTCAFLLFLLLLMLAPYSVLVVIDVGIGIACCCSCGCCLLLGTKREHEKKSSREMTDRDVNCCSCRGTNLSPDDAPVDNSRTCRFAIFENTS